MRHLLVTVAAVGLLSATSSALADTVPPEASACNGRDTGAACNGAVSGNGRTTNGTCQPSTCRRLDYSHGIPPIGTTTYPCLMCIAATGTAGAAPQSTTTAPELQQNPGAAEDLSQGSCSCRVAGNVGRHGAGLGLIFGMAMIRLIYRRRAA